jgi:spermidine synthase
MDEYQPWGVTYYTVEEGTHTSFNTRRARIDLLTNPYYGRMLFIDGVLQSTSSDEKIYHSELIKIMRKDMPSSVLIVGGAEGALARHVLSSSNATGSVSKVDMVDWDEELVDVMKGECFAGDAFSDPRLTLVHEDIFEFIKDSEKYDYIILDLLDPSLNDLDWLLEVCRMCLQKSSKISMNAGGDKDVVEAIINSLDITGCYITKRTIQVPSFQQDWYLLDIELM